MGAIVPLILCGGSGTRLWPASRESAPKQFINFLGKCSTFQETIHRISAPAIFAAPVIVTAARYRHMVAEQLAALGVSATILLEPEGRDSGPAAAAGSHFIAGQDPQAIVMMLAADHMVEDVASFRAAAQEAAASAQQGQIVAFGVHPDHAATGYGYIRPDGAGETPAIRAVAAFIEKPDAAAAQNYVAAGYLWNSGNLVFRADQLLAEYARFDPETVSAAAEAVAGARYDFGCPRLEETSFARTTPASIDVAVLEKTKTIRVLPVSMGWRDIGSWDALWSLTEKDGEGNAARGEALFVEAEDNYVLGDNLVAVVGLSGLAVIQTRDATLVTDRSKAEALKPLVAMLKQSGRPQIEEPAYVYRPWGSYQAIDRGERFQVKRIEVKPGGRLSLQRHFHRAEHWIVVRGTALVTIGNTEKLLYENESTFIPIGAVHRLENPGKIPLELIEVQSGTYLAEDDVVRLDDDYDRLRDGGWERPAYASEPVRGSSNGGAAGNPQNATSHPQPRRHF
ncbi:mannose-1-phosphate guanylyltransferase/mannose-6-phosphate isomerase [Afifella marina]|uniref:mannose-1-phosphate guanylyltransferase n=1 Tax=Afifella marina DSM 2698 TaxID=1120955 RepID=A0A1G5M7G6_AFIMA|nr:mannose-1-phosphate guanylyltransferase/mannose-6-phosphate isomerase [Afifella marina]MBK1622877.1 mannose-1-phosphate guanylyltransferase/mannose-6-phosphate isomerase [Afifella marina DSM 2698]MBK1625872.1 mannose-1-phosphate guanylyltransferase/mannose-6-phosphate isomerase [Afifella marina]MBK5917694.1 mannose-1-phosphate guanylyltransferase/mannose-6-phosphate isomerase [Afifella marina]RAI23615.1 mannose-1-phosphate guanylyltransferase/mannose-6-phosphate isomerase [Afifella marina DS